MSRGSLLWLSFKMGKTHDLVVLVKNAERQLSSLPLRPHLPALIDHFLSKPTKYTTTVICIFFSLFWVCLLCQ